MPTIVTHAAVPLCLGLGLGSRIIPPRLLLAGVAIAMLPDADVLAFKLGVAYGHVFGHRGFTHSLLFAFALPTLAMLFHRQLRASVATAGRFCWSLCSPTACSIPSPPAARGLAGSGRGWTSVSLPPGK